MIVPAAPTFIRNNDVEHDYRQSSDLFYLTGFDEPHSVLLLTNQHPDHKSVLFLQQRNPERETWDGPRLGVERACEVLGIDAAYPIEELDQHLPGYMENVKRVHYAFGNDRAFDERFLLAQRAVKARSRLGVVAPSELVDPRVTLHELRMVKSEAEVRTMERALAITHEAHVAAMQLAAPGRYEYEVEAELLRTFRQHGSERAAYGSIVGSGPNATILHYRKNDRKLEDGDLLLIDAGAELDYYASDITRTFPVSGRFTEPQKQMYELVLRSQLAAIEAVKPGGTIDGIHEAALNVLVDGMFEYGLLKGDRDKAMDNGDYRAFYMHRTSHWLGMDVHDVGAYHEDGEVRPLEPGYVLTVEPGIYIRPDAEVDERYRGIGIRIEDDILVTEEGHRNLSADIPKTVDEIEQTLAKSAE